ncbi:MAG: helix-turn-helix domain-containing protein, partial [bacterium]|nr:helix-turn-helix domain-containing protein [bacterium]
MAKSDKSKRKELGLRFLLFRKAIGKTVSQLASGMNVSRSEIKSIENGISFPNIKYL